MYFVYFNNKLNSIYFKRLQTQNVTKYNVRKSLRNPVSQNGNEPMGSIPRKTLLHSRDGTCDETEKIGIQNSHFNLHNVDSKLAHLAQIHLVLEHLLLIRSTLNLEDGNLYGYSIRFI